MLIKNVTVKNKYLVQVFAFAFVFMLVSGPVLASEITTENVLKHLNQSRQEKGLMDLTLNDKLIKAAQDKMDDMIKNNYFAHTSPDGISPWNWFAKNGYNYKYAGENLAINFLTVEAQHQAWMESTSHRKNILNPNYKEVGIAIGAGKINGETSIIAVEEFGVMAGAKDAVNDSRNFSGKEKTNLVEEGKKITPQVLSVKNVNVGNGNGKNSSITFLEKMKKTAPIFSEVALIIAVLLLLAPVLLAPTAFLAVAFDNLLAVYQKIKTDKPESLNDYAMKT